MIRKPIKRTVVRKQQRPVRHRIPKRFVNNYERFLVIRGTEMARMLGVDKWTLYRWCEKDGMPYRMFGKQFTFNLKEVEAWLKANDTSTPVDESVQSVDAILEVTNTKGE